MHPTLNRWYRGEHFEMHPTLNRWYRGEHFHSLLIFSYSVS